MGGVYIPHIQLLNIKRA